jgi:hypothetical protein
LSDGTTDVVEYCWPSRVTRAVTAPSPATVTADAPETAIVAGGTGRRRLEKFSITTLDVKV